jgi:2-dehydro-3-deoxyphosphogluconate aldolase/(4S)-4-hydroxy-2-oxoglutarate aldolase
VNLDVPVVGILRGVDSGSFRSLMDTSFAAGLEALEITMNTEDALQIVSRHRPAVPQGKLLGMGTICNLEEARSAVAAGAMFLVTPNTDTRVIEYARANAVPVIAGALTPTEVHAAWSAGADMVKVFPCRAFGPSYIRELLGPFDAIPLVAVGGVDLDNVGEYFAAGARAVAASTSLFGRTALRDRDLDGIARNVARFIALCPTGNSSTS